MSRKPDRREIKAKELGDGYKLFYSGANVQGRNGVGIVVCGDLKNSVTEVHRKNDRIMRVKMCYGGETMNIISAYAPQVGCTEEEKGQFWSEMDGVMQEQEEHERVIVGADLNGHVGNENEVIGRVHGGHGKEDRGVLSSPGGSVRDSSSGSSSVHGLLLCGLGRSPTRPKGVREVVRRGEDVAHQSSRDEGSLARTAIVSEDSHCPSSDGDVRQLDGCSVRQQARKNAFSFHVRTDEPPSQMDGEHRRPFGSEIPARTDQRPSGSLKPSGSGHCNGVDSPLSGGKGTPKRVGLAVDRPVRVETQRSAAGLLLPSPGRPGGSRGCVRVPALRSARKGTVMSTAVSKLFDDSGSSSLGRQGLVCGSTAPADASTSRSASVGRRHSPAPQRSPPPRCPRVETSRVATVKQLLRKSGFSRGEASDMSRCVCESTSNVYQSKWLTFCNWCRGRGVAPVNASVPLIVDFFRHLVRDKGLSVPAVRGYRASLNSVFALKGRDLAASREVSILFRSFSKSARPE